MERHELTNILNRNLEEPAPACRHRQGRDAAKAEVPNASSRLKPLTTEEPDELIAHVRICGGSGG